jgi:LemA protein
MELLTLITIIIVAIIAIALIWLVLTYNGLINLKNQVENSWSQIDVQLKRRYDLVPNLVETVKAYAKHEKETFTQVVEARNKITTAKTTKERVEAENILTGALKSIFALAEDYPKLQANQNFLMLQEELSGIESKVAFARQFYNDTVMNYNNAIQQFPTTLIAEMLGFKKREYFEIETEAKAPVKIKF